MIIILEFSQPSSPRERERGIKIGILQSFSDGVSRGRGILLGWTGVVGTGTATAGMVSVFVGLFWSS